MGPGRHGFEADIFRAGSAESHDPAVRQLDDTDPSTHIARDVGQPFDLQRTRDHGDRTGDEGDTLDGVRLPAADHENGLVSQHEQAWPLAPDLKAADRYLV